MDITEADSTRVIRLLYEYVYLVIGPDINLEAVALGKYWWPVRQVEPRIKFIEALLEVVE